MSLNVDGFKLITCKFDDSSKVIRNIFVKHKDPPSGKSVLLANLPPFIDETGIKNLFNGCGNIKHIIFGDDLNFDEEADLKKSKFFDPPPKHSSTACVIFERVKSVPNVFRIPEDKPIILYGTEEVPVTGIEKMKIDYNNSFINEEELLDEINEYMVDYDKRVQEEIEKAKAKENVPDEEGWVTVNRHGKRPFIPNVESIHEKILKKERKAITGVPNFYNFQKTQTKLENLASLRAQFEEDKKKIATMKANRKFKPM